MYIFFFPVNTTIFFLFPGLWHLIACFLYISNQTDRERERHDYLGLSGSQSLAGEVDSLPWYARRSLDVLAEASKQQVTAGARVAPAALVTPPVPRVLKFSQGISHHPLSCVDQNRNLNV